MPTDSATTLAGAIRQNRLLEPAQADELDRLQAAFPEPRALAAELIRRGWLTPYQVNQLLQDRGPNLLLGSYILLERVGEGGMGAVFKARNWKLGKTVALKLIRPERLDNPDAVRRFHREIRAAAQLDHPNIVRAIDADEVNGTHLLVMEYVQGTDLAKVVKKDGPLPADKACDYCRQVALGLQHASERGLVHRDVKPHNLLLTPGGVVKILDMGLARLDQAQEEGEASSTVTREGAVMGTLDFIAPEQAMDSHTVDVRADLYSLGCTLYYLLTGRVPFPGGTAMEKLLKHQSKQPEPVERLRPGVPFGVALVVRKLMAKRPDDRYPTPAAAASALASAATAPTAGQAPSSAVVVRAEADETTAAWASIVTSPETEADPQSQRDRAARRALVWLLSGAAGLVVLALSLAGLIAFLGAKTAPPTPAPGGAKPAADDVVHDRDRHEPADVPVRVQIQSLTEELRKRNPGFDGRLTPTIEDGVVTGLEFLADDVTNLRPIQALPGLKKLVCRGSDAGKGRLADLSALRNTHLTALDCDGTAVADLSPLRGLPLTSLSCGHTNVSDLSPLRDSSLTELKVRGLKGADLSPLRGLALTALQCDLHSEDDVELVRSIKTLETINETPAADFWARHDSFMRTLVGKGGPYSSIAGLNGDAFGQWIEEARVHGYRPLFVNGCDAGGSPRFACIARKDVDGPAWQLRFNLTWAEYQGAFEDLVAQRYYPASTTGYLSGPAVRYAGVWVRIPFPARWEAHHSMRLNEYRDKLTAMKAVGMRPLFASAYPDGAGSQLYAGLFGDAGPKPWDALYDLTAGQYEKAIDSWRAKGFHPNHLSVCDAADGPRFAVILLKDDSPCVARTGLSAEEYQAEMEKQVGEGRALASVAGYREGGALRYAAVWLRND